MSRLLERQAALSYLEAVAGGAPVEPLSYERALVLTSVTMSLLRPSFSEPVPLDRAASIFVALLAHPDLPGYVLLRVASDGLVGHPSVFAALSAHPGCTPEVLLHAGLTAWEQAGAAKPASGPLAELRRTFATAELHSALFERLGSLGMQGRIVSHLLGAVPRDPHPYFHWGLSLFDEPSAVQEVALALLDDARSAPRSRRPLSPEKVVELALDRSRLLLA